jgi:SAM-dependent MidA family methyltransferase
LAQAAKGVGVQVHGPVTQAEFLRRLGIEQRAAALRASAPEKYAAAIGSELDRLTSEERTGMGRLVKALALGSPNLERLPGFEG